METTHQRDTGTQSPDHRPPWMPRGWEWLFWCGALLLVVASVATTGGSINHRIAGNLIVIGGVLVVAAAWIWKAPQSRAEEARIKGPIYKSWWVPRSFRIRALSVVAMTLIVLLIASQAHSVRGALEASAAFLALMLVSAWTGSSGNYVELQSEALKVSKVVSAGRVATEVVNSFPYSGIDCLRVKKNGDFELRVLDKGRRDKMKKVSFKIVPERRREFLMDLQARVQQARPEGFTLKIEGDLIQR